MSCTALTENVGLSSDCNGFVAVYARGGFGLFLCRVSCRARSGLLRTCRHGRRLETPSPMSMSTFLFAAKVTLALCLNPPRRSCVSLSGSTRVRAKVMSLYKSKNMWYRPVF